MNRLPDLTGKTVLVVGAVPCDIGTVAADYVIAVSAGVKNAPNADMLVSIDNNMAHAVGWDEKSFTGIRVIGIPSADEAHIYCPFPYESIQVAPGHVTHFRNNGTSAIRLAADRGAKRVLIAGFDAAAYDRQSAPLGFDGVLVNAMPALIAELRGRGLTVEYVPAPTIRKRTA